MPSIQVSTSLVATSDANAFKILDEFIGWINSNTLLNVDESERNQAIADVNSLIERRASGIVHNYEIADIAFEVALRNIDRDELPDGMDIDFSRIETTIGVDEGVIIYTIFEIPLEPDEERPPRPIDDVPGRIPRPPENPREQPPFVPAPDPFIPGGVSPPRTPPGTPRPVTPPTGETPPRQDTTEDPVRIPPIIVQPPNVEKEVTETVEDITVNVEVEIEIDTEGLQDSLENIETEIEKGNQGIIDAVTDNLKEVVDATETGLNAILGVLNEIADELGNPAKVIIEAVEGFFDPLIDGIEAIINGIELANSFGFLEGLETIATKITDFITEITRIYEDIKTLLTDGFDFSSEDILKWFCDMLKSFEQFITVCDGFRKDVS